ncbi:hypothetical protein BCR34DRAFT_591798 [Clohesyomyces aquaticus]|uniref:Uncharacterized protein n=1 Tax=Clohesyomyces aquaticus TaxID=1231657 RepID=A0A1Y1YZ59_9PLEO|nr:hypothetical protein BCR34DRAFT_591798 [Clohesyomyces aquaticus]
MSGRVAKDICTTSVRDTIFASSFPTSNDERACKSGGRRKTGYFHSKLFCALQEPTPISSKSKVLSGSRIASRMTPLHSAPFEYHLTSLSLYSPKLPASASSLSSAVPRSTTNKVGIIRGQQPPGYLLNPAITDTRSRCSPKFQMQTCEVRRGTVFADSLHPAVNARAM